MNKYRHWSRGMLLVALGIIAGSAHAAPTPTVDDIMTKYIAATGGADAYGKITSMVAKGTVSVMPMGVTGTTTIYAKAPSKFLVVATLAGLGDSRTGYDGTVGWSQDVISGLRVMTGAELADLQRQADTDAALHWKTQYKTAESLGLKKVGDVDTYAVKLTPAVGAPVTEYFDAKTFYLLEEDSTQEGPNGNVPVISTFSDYRDINGVKTAYTTVQKIAGIATETVTLTDVKTNVPVADSLFAKPSGAAAPAPAAPAPAALPADPTKT